MLHEVSIALEARLHFDEILASLLRDLQRQLQHLLSGRLPTIWEKHLFEIRHGFLSANQVLLLYNRRFCIEIFTLRFFLSILHIRFIPFAFLFEKLLISVVEVEYLLYPVQPLLELCLILDECEDHLVLSLELLPQISDYLIFLIYRFVEIPG